VTGSAHHPLGLPRSKDPKGRSLAASGLGLRAFIARRRLWRERPSYSV